MKQDSSNFQIMQSTLGSGNHHLWQLYGVSTTSGNSASATIRFP